MAQWDKLMELKKKLGLEPMPLSRSLRDAKRAEKRYRISDVRYENMTKMDALFLRTKFRLHEGDSIDDDRATLITTSIRRDLFYKEASYRFDLKNETDATVVFSANTQKGSKLSIGLRFDNEEMVAVQTNAALPLGTKVPGQADITLRLGKRIMARANLAFFPWSYIRPSLSYEFRHNDINLYSKGDKRFNMTYNQHSADLKLLNFDVRNFNFSLGAVWDYYHYNNLLVSQLPEHSMEPLSDAHYYTYYGQVEFNSEDDWYFPVTGSRFKAMFSYVTDNFLELNNSVGMRQYSLMWRTSLPLGSVVTLRPMAYGRLLYGNNIPNNQKNIVGGPFFSHYMPQQMPFAGVRFIEEVGDKFMALQLEAQFKITGSSIILAKFVGAQDSPTMKNLFDYQTRLGGSLGYYFNTPFGPLGGSVGYSNISKGFYYYVNLGFEF